jgi:D-xylonolactonase
MEPELIADYACVTGEGPLWHPQEQRVYWADIPKGKLFRYDPQSGKHEEFFDSGGASIGGFTFQDDGAILLFMDRGAVKLLRDGKLETIIEEIPDERETRFNDVFADPEGRVYCGTMPTKDRLGRLYRLDPDRKLTLLLEGITCSNGMGFTLDRKQLYYTDSMVKKIYLFDYDQATGNITNQRIFVDTSDQEGVPDGMTVDADGNVWSARWDGYRLTQYAPDGSELRRVMFPAKKVSSVIFGGADYRDMYVTTAGGNDKHENGATAGALYRLRLGVQGSPEFPSRIR